MKLINRKMTAGSFLMLAILLSITGCDPQGRVNRQSVGQVTGGILGGILGSQVRGSGRTAATIGGVLLGGYLGGVVGNQMDQNDRNHLAYSLEHSPTHHASRWRDPDHHREFVAVPVSTYRDQRNYVCRRFRTSIVIDGRIERATGRACRLPNGTWQIVR